MAVGATLLAIALAAAALFGGVQSVVALWDRWRGSNPDEAEDKSASPTIQTEKLIDTDYLHATGILEREAALGYQVKWERASAVLRRIEAESWEYTLSDDGAILKMKDRPEDQTLLRRRLPFRARLIGRAKGNPRCSNPRRCAGFRERLVRPRPR